MRFSTLLTAGLLALVTAKTDAAQTQQPFTTEDALNVASASIQATTDDGRYAAMTRWTQRDRKNVDHLRFGDPTYIAPSFADVLVVDATDGSSQMLFDHKVQARAFDWSPDGTTLAFLLLQGDQYTLHTWHRPSGALREVEIDGDRRVAAGSVVQWRPDGSGILVYLHPAGWATEAREAYSALAEGPVIVQDSREPFLAWDAVRIRSQQYLLAVANPETGATRILSDSVESISGLVQSDDGAHISFVHTNRLKTSYTRQEGTEYTLMVIDTEDGTRRTLRGPDNSRPGVEWSRDGTRFAYADEGHVFVQTVLDSTGTQLTPAGSEDDDSSRTRYSVEQWRPDAGALLLESEDGYYVLASSGGEPRLVLPTSDGDDAPNRNPVHWSADGRHIFFTHSARDRWERGMVRLDVQSGQVDDLVRDASLYTSWRFSEDGQRVFYAFSDGDLPSDLFVTNPDFSRTVRLTQLNPWLANRTLTRSELVEYLDVDGNTLYGILYYPVNYDPTRKYPLVAEIYERFFNNGFNHRMNLLANEGFFGFRPSVDLEIGYPGEAWLKGVTAGINTLIERGLVDGEKLGVHGTSYGGYATNLLITQTDRFAAAINISGKVNIISFLGDSPKITTRNYYAAESGQDRIGATLWEQPHKYVAHSAVMYADRINTPLLLMSGEGDWNVPATNQREMYYALRRLGKEVVWVHYMNAGHGAGRSSTVEDFHDHWARILGWYNEHFFKDTEARSATGEGNASN